MPQPSILILTLLLGFLAQQFPPPYGNSNPHPSVERPLPTNQPEVVTPSKNQRHIDPAQLTREAKELAKLGDEIPSLIEQANNGILSKDLNERLKRIEKLSKQLRREITP